MKKKGWKSLLYAKKKFWVKKSIFTDIPRRTEGEVGVSGGKGGDRGRGREKESERGEGGSVVRTSNKVWWEGLGRREGGRAGRERQKRPLKYLWIWQKICEICLFLFLGQKAHIPSSTKHSASKLILDKKHTLIGSVTSLIWLLLSVRRRLVGWSVCWLVFQIISNKDGRLHFHAPIEALAYAYTFECILRGRGATWVEYCTHVGGESSIFNVNKERGPCIGEAYAKNCVYLARIIAKKGDAHGKQFQKTQVLLCEGGRGWGKELGL